MSCVECFTGMVRHDEKPQGIEVTLHGRKTYVAEPDGEAKGIIIIIPDAFGIEFLNNKVLADHYAKKGDFRVYLPDFMDGHSAPTSMMVDMSKLVASGSWLNTLLKPYYLFRTLAAFIPFMMRNGFGPSMAKVQAYFESVRNEEGSSLPIGAAGFCWGGKHVFKLCEGLEASNGKPLVDAGYTAHPSNLSIPADIVNVKKPISIANGDQDMVLSFPKLKEVEAILNKIEGVETEVVVYPGAGHGFAVRGDMVKNEKQSQQAIEAEDQAVHFWKRVFAKVSY